MNQKPTTPELLALSRVCSTVRETRKGFVPDRTRKGATHRIILRWDGLQVTGAYLSRIPASQRVVRSVN